MIVVVLVVLFLVCRVITVQDFFGNFSNVFHCSRHSDEGSHNGFSGPSSMPLTPTPSPVPVIDIEQQTDSNHDTALSVAAAGGHDDLVKLLLERGAVLEHKDKKG